MAETGDRPEPSDRPETPDTTDEASESAPRRPAERPAGADVDADPAALQRRVRSRAATVQRRELERAVDRMEATGSLSREQRRIVGALAAAVVDGILAVPETAAERAIDGDAAATAVLELFNEER